MAISNKTTIKFGTPSGAKSGILYGVEQNAISGAVMRRLFITCSVIGIASCAHTNRAPSSTSFGLPIQKVNSCIKLASNVTQPTPSRPIDALAPLPDFSWSQRASFFGALRDLTDPTTGKKLPLPGTTLIKPEQRKFDNEDITLIHELGEGSEGVSYLAIYKNTLVVFKDFLLEKQRPSFIQSLRNRVLISEFLESQGFSVARIYGVDEKNGTLIKEYIPGPTAASSYEDDPLTPLKLSGKALSQARKSYAQFVAGIKALLDSEAAKEFQSRHKIILDIDVGGQGNVVYFNGFWWLIDI